MQKEDSYKWTDLLGLRRNPSSSEDREKRMI